MARKKEKNKEQERPEKKKPDNALVRRFKQIAAPFVRFYETNVIVRHVRRFLQKCTEDNIPALSGQSAFFVIISIVPLVVFVFLIMSLFVKGSQEDAAMVSAAAKATQNAKTAEETLGSFAREMSGIMYKINSSRSAALPITIILALWSAGKGMYIITDGISRIYRLPAKHMWIFRRVFAMGYTFVLLLMIALTLGILVLNAYVTSYIGTATESIPFSTEMLYGLRYVITTAVMALFLTVTLKLYLRRKVEDKRYIKFRVLLPGMLFTAIAWSVLSWGVEFYSEHFTSTVYGGLGTVVLVLLWVYFVMMLLLYGVQLNYIYREQFYNYFGIRKGYLYIKHKLSQRKNKKKDAEKAASP